MKSWFKKIFSSRKESVPVNETGIHPATLNWFIHVLIKNVGYNEWIRMTREEKKKYNKDHPYDKGYPYKVVTHPIPKGKDIILKDSKTYTINCDSEETRNMIIEMAKSYDALERKYCYLSCENAAIKWHKVSELRPISRASSIRGPRIFFVASPELCYVNGGTAMGMENEGKWYVFLDGKKIEHKVTHYRLLPPRPTFEVPPYELVEAEVERLKGKISL